MHVSVQSQTTLKRSIRSPSQSTAVANNRAERLVHVAAFRPDKAAKVCQGSSLNLTNPFPCHLQFGACFTQRVRMAIVEQTEAHPDDQLFAWLEPRQQAINLFTQRLLGEDVIEGRRFLVLQDVSK